MKALLLLAALPLAACNTANQAAATSFLHGIAQDYAPCERTVTYAASVGAMNPGSGAQIQGTIHCPPHDPTTGKPIDPTPAPPQ